MSSEISRPMPRPTAQVAPYVEVLGLELAIAFLLRFGGAPLYLPQDPKGKSEVEKLLGHVRLKELAARPGLQLRIPLAKRWLAEVLHWQGYSNAEIARKIRVTDGTIKNYLARRYAAGPDDEARS